MRHLVLIAAVLALTLFYLVSYHSFALVPGNNPDSPQGWWLWDDQRLYLRGAYAFAHGDFRASEHFYPPFYPLIGALFLPFSPNHPFLAPDLLFAIAYLLVFVALFTRYVGLFGSVACALAGMWWLEALRLQWVMPWTSTPGAFFAISALFLLDRYARMRADPNAWASANNAILFGLAVGFEVTNRPADVAIAGPMALAYAALVLTSLVKSGARKDWAAAAGGCIGFLIPLALYFGFNEISFGTISGRYFVANERIGFFLRILPQELFSHLLSSSAFFAEPHADWASQIPAALIAVAFLPVVLFTGPFVMRVVAASALTQFVLYYCDTDIIPTGTFRFCNIHYFKWLIPIAFCILFYFAKQALYASGRPRRQAIAALAGGAVFELAMSCVSAAPHYQSIDKVAMPAGDIDLDLPGETFDFIDLSGVSGRWGAIYFASGPRVVFDGARELAVVRDYRLLPLKDGVRILFFTPVVARKMSIHLAVGMAASEVGARAAQVRFTLRPPLQEVFRQ